MKHAKKILKALADTARPNKKSRSSLSETRARTVDNFSSHLLTGIGNQFLRLDNVGSNPSGKTNIRQVK